MVRIATARCTPHMQIFQSDDGKLIARTMRPDNSELYEFEILGFELLETGKRYE